MGFSVDVYMWLELCGPILPVSYLVVDVGAYLLTRRFDNVMDTIQYEFFVSELPAASSLCAAGSHYVPTVLDPTARCWPCHPSCTQCVGPLSTGECVSGLLLAVLNKTIESDPGRLPGL